MAGDAFGAGTVRQTGRHYPVSLRCITFTDANGSERGDGVETVTVLDEQHNVSDLCAILKCCEQRETKSRRR